jgi:ribosomal protein S18 acetylase RimI-like enzyme
VVAGAVTVDPTFRRPTEADHARIVGSVDDWWGGRRMRALLPRLWFQHFTGTSWIAETADGTVAGFLIGFVSPDRPTDAYVHLIATNPNLRRRGLGRALYERFFDDVRGQGVRRVLAITWPGNRASVGFHRAMGFVPSEGPGFTPIYGTPAYPDYDADGEDRVVFVADVIDARGAAVSRSRR